MNGIIICQNRPILSRGELLFNKFFKYCIIMNGYSNEINTWQ